MQRIQPIHTRVSGRARFKIPGLRRSPPVKHFLERRLAANADILEVTASSITGNLLISYNSDNDHRSIAEIVQAVVSEYAPMSEEVAGAHRSARRQTTRGSDRPATPTLPPPSVSPPADAIDAAGHDAWHCLRKQTLLESLQTSAADGLADPVADDRLKQHGSNRLPEAVPRRGWQILLDQMNSLPTYLLGAAAGVSLLTGGALDAVVIMGVVVANAVIGYITESEAEKTIHSLKQLVRPRAEIIRNGRTLLLPVEAVVPGDLIVLKPGVYVAADARIISSDHLSIDESMLTGESLPAHKHARPLRRHDLPLADRSNMAYMGTLVTGGQGLAVAVATGRFTQIGRIQVLLNQTRPPETPIERQLGRMGDQLVIICGAVCGVVFLIGLFRGYGFFTMLRMSISLAAAAVPEGLPAAATVNFALGITRMRRHKVLIRHLQAVETLGAVQALCLDKTGTITHNRMTVQRICAGARCVEVIDGRLRRDNADVDPFADPALGQLITACALCHEIKINGPDGAGRIQLCGSSTETALVQLAIDAGLDVRAVNREYRRLAINHRSENRLYVSTMHRTPEGDRLYCVKGSPPEVLAMCDREAIDGSVAVLTRSRRRSIEAENEKMAAQALRVLGFAGQRLDQDAAEAETGLVWLGLVGMADPVREGVQPLIEVFHGAGIDTVMITGDQHATAYAVAQSLNLSGGDPLEILDSADLSRMETATLQALARKAHVYSRVSPANKLQIVQALQSAGVTVAMTGDGINDGPALKAADIGIAMGKTGTDVARDVADVVLEEDNLETLILALRDGRTIHGNIRKSVHFFLATNLSEIMLMTAAMGLGIGFPLNVMQLLWINIISDIFPGMALSMEAAEGDVMRRPPRDAQAPLFSGRDFLKMTRESAAITGGALAAYGVGIARYGMGAGAASLAFQSLTIGQLLHALSCRSEHSGLFSGPHLAPNPYLNAAVCGSLVLQALTMVVPPLRSVLGLTVPSLADLAVIAGSALASLVFNESAKAEHDRRGRAVEQMSTRERLSGGSYA